MKKLVYYLILTVLFGGGLYWYYAVEYPKIPKRIRTLDERIEARNEKLISAQILANQLDLVARLIDRNLAISQTDSLAQDASMPFLEFVTNLLDQYKITMIALEPDKKQVRRHDFVKNSYYLIVECSYKEFGKLVNDLEKSDRLITLEEFEVNNNVQSSANRQDRRRPDTHMFEMKISTLTLIKHS
ncbi:hypothetical protein GF324_02845 [bacterium]|nr:hypothetical protein [bacterium]